MVDVFNIIKQDCYRYAGKIGIKEFITNKGLRFTTILRLTALLPPPPPIRLIFKMILRHLTIKYGYEIAENTQIGAGLALMHLGGIVINPQAVIGENCTIYRGVTIGGAWKGDKVYAPHLGDFVWIGPNAVIVGNVKIGNNVLIAGNSFVNRDIPDNSLVVGNPMTIKPFNRIRQYVQYVLEDTKLIS